MFSEFAIFDKRLYHEMEVYDMEEESDGNRVLTKGKSPAKVLRGFNTSKGHKARKQFWK